MEHNIHMNQIKSSSGWRPYALPEYHNKNKYNEWYKNQNISIAATIPIENLKNCTNCEIKIAPVRDGRTTNVKNIELQLSSNLRFVWQWWI